MPITWEMAEHEHDIQRRMFWTGVWFLLAVLPSSVTLTFLYNNRPLAWVAMCIIFLPMAAAALSLRARPPKVNVVWALRYMHGGCFLGLLMLALDNISISTPFFWWMTVVPMVVLLSGLTWLGVGTGTVVILYAVFAYNFPGRERDFAAAPLRLHIAVALSMSYAIVYLGLATLWRKRLQAALSIARIEASQAATAKARFIANMSHEIRTPLYGVIGAVELLRSPGLSQAQRAQLLGLQAQSANTLLVLINDVLDWSKLDAGKVVLSKEPQDVRALVLEANELFAVAAFDKGVELTSSSDPDVPNKLLGDGARIRQIVNNLVGNAVKFTRRGGVHIHVSIAQDEDLAPSKGPGDLICIQFEVSDTGVGIAPERIGDLFKPFTQVEPTVSLNYGGTGLGLSISKELATLMGGRITVRSALDQGSTFSLRLPMGVVQDELGVTPKPVLRNDAMFVCSNPGLIRHFMSRFYELGVEAEITSTLPIEDSLSRLKFLLVDERLVSGRANAIEWLERIKRPDLKVAVIAPLNADSVADIPAEVIYKPVSRRSLQQFFSDEASVPARDASSPSEQDLTGLRVLVAENAPINQFIVQKMLEQLGATCVIAADGAEALERIKEEAFSIALVDLNMPEVDGVEVATQWRFLERAGASPWDYRLPIVALTANSRSDLREIVKQAGMDGVIVKPFTINDLATAVVAAVKKGPATR